MAKKPPPFTKKADAKQDAAMMRKEDKKVKKEIASAKGKKK
jgi:hypothetical protein